MTSPNNSVIIQVSTSCKPSVKFTNCESIITALSLFVYLVDIVTDIILGVQYLKSGYYEWGVLTIILCIVPLIIIQLISLRWHQVDQTPVNLPVVLLHCSLLGVVQRYMMVLKLGFQSRQAHESVPHLQHHQSDICLLRLFESFLESAPQLLLQLYVMHELGSWHPWTAVCAVGSLVSLAWGIASYARTMRNVHEGKARITWIGLALQAVWRTGTMVARIISLLLCASVIHNWFVLAISIHWLGMTVWTIRQKTDLCSTAWEERVYNGVVGVIYCFCFFNVKEGPSRHRAMIFYTITCAENVGCLAIFLQFSQAHANDQWLHTVAPILIVGGALIGHTSQMVYYCWFHPSGPIKVVTRQTAEPNSNATPVESPPAPALDRASSPAMVVRTLKYINPMSRKYSGVSLASNLPATVAEAEMAPPLPKKNSANSKDTHVGLERPVIVKGTLKSRSDSNLIEILIKPTLVMVKSKSDGQLITTCTTDKTPQLKPGLDDDDDDGAVSDETSSVSVHDYENMAALNVNRTDWGIRHWKSYSDIENSFHDNSVCKEREVMECSTTSASSADSSRVVAPGSKISVEEAISQLKSLALYGRNVFQSDAVSSDLYDYIWVSEDGKNSTDKPMNRRPCPTTGQHNLSTITEMSENSSMSSTSKSSLVQTVDTIMDGSIYEASPSKNEGGRLTYVEVSFLSKLNGSVSDIPKPLARRQAARRQFSIIREHFGSAVKFGERSCEMSRTECDKENFPELSPETMKSPRRKSQSTLSPHSRIFSP